MKKVSISELLFKSEETKKFCLEHKLTEEEMIINSASLFAYKDALAECAKCNGKECLASVKEMIPSLKLEDNRRVTLSYLPCPKEIAMDTGNFEVISYSDSDIVIDVTKERLEILEMFKDFNNKYFSKTNEFVKGIYLYGKCGVGKSLLMYNFAKNLAKKGAKVIFAYYPDLAREFQNNFGTVKSEQLINRLKKVDILILDDIGREANTAYIRDQILGPILQYRCDNELAMFVTSNRDINLLERHLSETNNVIDNIKAKALASRLKFLMNECQLNCKDYREN